ncbi:MAG: cell division protein FtsA [Chloroflexi bacterium]|nr:cell division protein FtsA [Chloroflexota bacterium]
MIQDDHRAVIDLGTTKVCTILGKKRPDGSIEIAGIGVAPCSGLKRGLVADPEATTSAVMVSVGAASKAAGMPIRQAYLGLTGSHVKSRNVWSKVDGFSGVSVVTQEDVRRALAVASEDAAEEGRDLLHVIPRSYALDGIYGVRNPLGMHAAEMYVQAHAILGDQHPIETLQAAVQAAGIGISGLIVEPVGAAEAVLTDAEREEGVIMVDIGGGTTDIAVFYEGSIIHTAVLPIGGYQFTNDIAISFNATYEESERVKLRFASAVPDARTASEEFGIESHSMDEPLIITRREIGQLMSERATELMRLMMKKLDEPHLKGLRISQMVLTGGGVKLDGFQAIARYIFQGHVRTASPRGAVGLLSEHQDPQFSASVGMLLWSMRNLPRESHASRKVSGRADGRPNGRGGLRASFKSLLPRSKAQTGSKTAKQKSGAPVGV